MCGDSGENGHLFSSGNSCCSIVFFLPAGFGSILCDDGASQTHSREQTEKGRDLSPAKGLFPYRAPPSSECSESSASMQAYSHSVQLLWNE